MLIFECPKCDDSLMAFNEAENTWVCSEVECQHEIEDDEAKRLFDEGELIGVLDDTLSEEDDDDDDDDDSDDDDSDDDDDDDDKDESFNGFSNRDTWITNLVLQNEFKVNKGAQAALSEAEEDDQADAIQNFVEKKVAKKDEFKDTFEDVDLDEVNWDEIIKSINDSASDYADIKAELSEALNIEELSEEDKEKVLSVFESALAVKYNELKANLEEKFDVDLEAAIDEKYADVLEELDGYLEDAINEWKEENKVPLENALRTEMTMTFMDGLKDLFKETYVDIPEDRYDVLEDLAQKVEELEGRLEESKDRENELQEKLNEQAREAVIKKLSKDLTETQTEKLGSLAESLDYESDEQFEKDLSGLKESFLKGKAPGKDGDVIDPPITEDDGDKKWDLNDPVQRTAYALRKRD